MDLSIFGSLEGQMVPKLVHLLPSVIISIILHFVLTAIKKYAGKVGEILLTKYGGEDFCKKNPGNIEKFKDRASKMLFHFFVVSYSVIFFYREKWWFFDTGYLTVTPPPFMKYGLNIRIYYIISLGYYILETVDLFDKKFRREKEKMKDFLEMFVHHLVTLLLILGSYYLRQCQFGVLVLFCHSLTDVITYGARMTSAVKWPYSNFALVFVILSWIVVRLCIFPLFVIGPGLNTLMKLQFVKEIFGLPAIFLIPGMAILYFLHVYWVYLMLSLFIRAIIKEINKEEADLESMV